MFGYVMINPDTLTDAEKQRFREVYCGVCASLRERGGGRGQITLSYDAAFLALVLNALYEPEEQKGSTLCATHPTRRQHFSKSPMTLYAADVNLLLFYERMLDNWKDDRSHVSLALSRFYRRRYQEAAARHPAQAQAIRKELQALSEVEKARLTDLDAAAGCFGRLLGAAFAPYDDVWDDRSETPWIGFVYTFPAYRGRHCAGQLLAYCEQLAAQSGKQYVYISTPHVGLYEKYGYDFHRHANDYLGNACRVYRKELS